MTGMVSNRNSMLNNQAPLATGVNIKKSGALLLKGSGSRKAFKLI